MRRGGTVERHGGWMMSRVRLGLVFALCLAATGGCALSDRVYETFTVHAPGHGVDVNRASVDELADLPGIGRDDAERIVQGRPYETKSDLVRRGVVSEHQFEQFQAHVYVGRAGETAAASLSEDLRHVAHAPNVGD
jgi:hypothetical protein